MVKIICAVLLGLLPTFAVGATSVAGPGLTYVNDQADFTGVTYDAQAYLTVNAEPLSMGFLDYYIVGAPGSLVGPPQGMHPVATAHVTYENGYNNVPFYAAGTNHVALVMRSGSSQFVSNTAYTFYLSYVTNGTATNTPTATLTKTPTRTQSATPTATLTKTPTPTFTVTKTPTPVYSNTPTFTATLTNSPTPTTQATGSNTVSPTRTVTSTRTQTPNYTPTPTKTPGA